MSRKDSVPNSPSALENQGEKAITSLHSNVSNEQDEDFGFTKAEQRRIIGRIDRRLVVMVGAMYCVSLMDRTNMSSANIAGMSKELVLTGFRYVSRPLCLSSYHLSIQRAQYILTLIQEHCQPGLLRHLHRLPTPLHRPHPQDWPPSPSIRHLCPLGRRHHRHGFRQELPSTYRIESSPGSPRGRFLPQLRVLA